MEVDRSSASKRLYLMINSALLVAVLFIWKCYSNLYYLQYLKFIRKSLMQQVQLPMYTSSVDIILNRISQNEDTCNIVSSCIAIRAYIKSITSN